jgi:TolA-binding protein
MELGATDSKKYEAAEKLFKMISVTKDWGLESKANAFYHLGLIAEKQKKWGEAIAWYQRVILAHQRYKNWLAKAYLHCAQCQINDGKTDDAKLVLRQMLDRKDIAEQPEFNEAKLLLPKLGN